MDTNDQLKLTIQRLGIHGEGIANLDGYTLFIEGALPGEVVLANLTEQKKTYGRGEIVDVISPSPDRSIPPCPLFGECGGCQLMHLSYSQQLVMKRQRVVDALERIGKLTGIEVEECLPSPQQLEYRNKIQLPVLPGRTGPRLGLYAKKSHDLVDVKQCLIHCSLGEDVYQQIRECVTKSSVIPYDPVTGKGELRHILIKTAVHTGQVLVIFVTTAKASAELMEVAKIVMSRCPSVKGVIQNINRASGNVILGSNFLPLLGEDFVIDRLCGIEFKVSPASFFQVNPQQAENLYKTAIDFALLDGTQTVLDAYCGVGTLSLILSKKAKRVIGVECVPEAIKDAIWNAKHNNIFNAEFHCAPAETFIQNIKESVDVILLNPPRKGCESSFLQGIQKLKPKVVVYVSCDPATLARDLSLLEGMGYRTQRVQPMDMFPQTAHVETVVQLIKTTIASTRGS